VELPGIELGTESVLTCEDAELGDAKQRETTCGDARGVDGVKTSGRQLLGPTGRDAHMRCVGQRRPKARTRVQFVMKDGKVYVNN
jgi:hypothetical protein